MKAQICAVALLALVGCACAQYASVQDAVAKLPELSMLNDNTNTIALADKLRDPKFVGTLFAPTNSALQPLQEAVGGDLSSLLGDPDQINDVFSTSVVSDKALSLSDLKDGQKLTTLNGNTVDVKVVQTAAGPIYYVNNAAVTTGNIKAGNSIIHEMSSIVVPPEYQDMLETLVPTDVSDDKPTKVLPLTAASATTTAAGASTSAAAASAKPAAAGSSTTTTADDAGDTSAEGATVARVLAKESPAPPAAATTAAPKPAGSSAGSAAVGTALLAVPALLAVLL